MACLQSHDCRAGQNIDGLELDRIEDMDLPCVSFDGEDDEAPPLILIPVEQEGGEALLEHADVVAGMGAFFQEPIHGVFRNLNRSAAHCLYMRQCKALNKQRRI